MREEEYEDTHTHEGNALISTEDHIQNTLQQMNTLNRHT